MSVAMKPLFDLEEAIRLYESGMSLLGISKHFANISNPTVKKKLKDAGIALRSHSDNQKLQNSFRPPIVVSDATKKKLSDVKKKDTNKPSKETLIAIYATPMSLSDVAKHYGVGLKVVQRWFMEYEIEPRVGGKTTGLKRNSKQRYVDIKPSREELEELYAKMTIAEVAKRFSVDKRVAANWLDEHGLDKHRQISRTENELFVFCLGLDSLAEQQNKKLIGPYEIDIYLPTFNLAIEFCGVYWHSSKFKNKNYHRMKYDKCKEMGIELITIFETDNLDKIKSIITKKTGNQEKVYARKCEVIAIDNKAARLFNEEHHLQDHINATITYGLFYDGNLVQLMSFIKSRYDKTYEWELARFTSGNVSVVGGASKLFKKFINDAKPTSLLTYSDLRFGSGSVYLNLGMEQVESTGPNYFYFYNGAIYSRVHFQKHKLADRLKTYDSSLTEEQNMANNGHYRLYDCGNAKYVWNKKGQP